MRLTKVTKIQRTKGDVRRVKWSQAVAPLPIINNQKAKGFTSTDNQTFHLPLEGEEFSPQAGGDAENKVETLRGRTDKWLKPF